MRARHLEAKRHTVEAITLGHSHNMAIDFDALGASSGYHVWSGGSDLFEAAHAADCLARRLPRLRTVYAPINYYAFVHDNRLIQREHLRIRHYASLPRRCMLPPVARPSAVWVRAATAHLSGRERLRDMVRAVLDGKATHDDVTVPPDGYLGPPRSALYQQAAPTGAANARKHLALAGHLDARQATQVEQRMRERLIRLHRSLRSRGVRLVLYTPPYARAYTETVQEAMPTLMARLQDNMAQVAATTGVEYYDFGRHEAMVNDTTLFWNPTHLNRRGAAVFSKALRVAMNRAASAQRPARVGANGSSCVERR